MTQPKSLHHRAYTLAERRYPARFGESVVNVDLRWAFHAGFMAGHRAAKRCAMSGKTSP